MLSMMVLAASGTLNMPCAELKNIELERATITSAVDVAAGLFKPAGAAGGPPPAIRARRRNRFRSTAA